MRALENVAGFIARWVLRIALPIGGAATMLHIFPYHAVAGGVRFTVEGTIFREPGLSADTTFGSWQFPHVDGLPVGAHLRPENVDLVPLAAQASRGGSVYADQLRTDFAHQTPRIILWLTAEALIGIIAGLLLAVAINLAVRYARHLPWRERELRHRVRQAIGVAAVALVVGAYGAASYDRDWVKNSRVTGTLAALQLFPSQLSQYYTHQSKFFDVLNGVAGIQAQLQKHIEQQQSPSTAFNIMFISDMHLASTYPLVMQYAQNFDVHLIVNTGDETEFGTQFEMTASYINQIKALTKVAPMVWLAGNHDSPETIRTMRSIPGVDVLGTKKERHDGTFAVTAQAITAYGLDIAAVPDPRVYGGGGAAGSNDPAVVRPLERKAVDEALAGVGPDQRFDIVATHEPDAAAEILKLLDGRVRQTNAGHLHAQNARSDIQHGKVITLVEGSTGAGGLDNINRGVPAPPVEFSIESVAGDCQFTRLIRFQLTTPPTAADVLTPDAQQVTASTTYLHAQDVAAGRSCQLPLGVGAVRNIG